MLFSHIPERIPVGTTGRFIKRDIVMAYLARDAFFPLICVGIFLLLLPLLWAHDLLCILTSGYLVLLGLYAVILARFARAIHQKRRKIISGQLELVRGDMVDIAVDTNAKGQYRRVRFHLMVPNADGSDYGCFVLSRKQSLACQAQWGACWAWGKAELILLRETEATSAEHPVMDIRYFPVGTKGKNRATPQPRKATRGRRK